MNNIKRQQNNLWFQSYRTIYYFFYLWWRHVSVTWPSSDHVHAVQITFMQYWIP